MASKITGNSFISCARSAHFPSSLMSRFHAIKPHSLVDRPFSYASIPFCLMPQSIACFSGLGKSDSIFGRKITSEHHEGKKQLGIGIKIFGVLTIGTLSFGFLKKISELNSGPRFNSDAHFITGTTKLRWTQDKGLPLEIDQIITLNDNMFCVPLTWISEKDKISATDKATIERNNEKARTVAKHFAQDPYASHQRVPDPKFITQNMEPVLVIVKAIEDNTQGYIGGAGVVDLYFKPGQRFQIVTIEYLPEMTQADKQRSYDNHMSLLSQQLRFHVRGL